MEPRKQVLVVILSRDDKGRTKMVAVDIDIKGSGYI